MRAYNLVPIFPELVQEFKETMPDLRNGGQITAAYVFGAAWANAVNNVFTPNKSQLADELVMDRKTLNVYLDRLTEAEYLEANEENTVYIISKSVRFRLTVSAYRDPGQELSTGGEHVPNNPGGEHVPKVGNMSPQIGDMFPTETPMINHDHDINTMGNIESIREVWKLLGLDVKGNAFKKMIDIYKADIEALYQVSSAWLDWWLKAPTNDKPSMGLLYTHLKNGELPPERELTFAEEIALMWEQGLYDEVEE